MKSPQKRMPAKKPRQHQKPKMSDQKDDNTVVLDLGNYGAAQPIYTLSGGSGIDTITIDPSLYTTSSITSASTISWNQDYSTSIGSSWVNIDSNGISIKEGGDLKIAGKSLSEAIEKIEERLGILNPNPELEDRWDQLKELRRQYIELEKDLLEKEKIMKILKEK
jgi:hypothetical protein